MLVGAVAFPQDRGLIRARRPQQPIGFFWHVPFPESSVFGILPWRGPLLEGWVHHELRAAMHDLGAGGDLSFWRLPSGLEVDFVWQRGDVRVGVEVKASERWRTEDGAGLAALHEAVGLTRQVVVYLGEARLKDGAREVLPFNAFVAELGAGSVLSPRA